MGSDDPAFAAPRYYSNPRTLFVEPLTGQVVNGTEDQLQTLRGPDGTDQITIIQGKLGFTDEEIAESVQEAKDNSAKLKLVSQTLPIVSLVLGLILLVIGILLARRPDDAQV